MGTNLQKAPTSEYKVPPYTVEQLHVAGLCTEAPRPKATLVGILTGTRYTSASNPEGDAIS